MNLKLFPLDIVVMVDNELLTPKHVVELLDEHVHGIGYFTMPNSNSKIA